MKSFEALTARIDALLAENGRLIVAVDGNCTSGKTTLAAALAEKYDCNVFHMDDFFLRPEQRTPARYAETGGNVDYERFKDEVLIPLQSGEPFSYRPFDCSAMALAEPVDVTPKKLTVIEGSYCLHPHFGDYADLKILLTISPELQRQRVLARPAFLHESFFTRWIPMEQQYLAGFSVADRCDMIINTTTLNLKG